MICKVLVCAGLLAGVPAHAQERPRHELTSGLLVPNADLIHGVVVQGHAFSVPAGLAGGLAFSLRDRVTLFAHAGAGYYPSILYTGAQAGLKLHVRRTAVDRWGVALQAQSMAGVELTSEPRGGTAHALALIVSSPIRRARLHAGGALHTMPGSEFEQGWADARDYDLSNPQATVFLAGDVSGQRLGAFAEVVWAAVDADDGWDSVLVGTVGGKLVLGRWVMKLGAGLVEWRFLSGSSRLLPAPPVLSMTLVI